jgi:gamma-glutamylcyclotransferase (GGCT)/AIG2-like uncharacterized protein YtfP
MNGNLFTQSVVEAAALAATQTALTTSEFFGWVHEYGEGLGSLVTAAGVVGGGLWVVWEYHRTKRHESAKWLHDLFSRFYLEPKFKKIRICLEFDYTTTLAPLIERVLIDERGDFSDEDKQLLCDLDTMLNHLEFILYLQKDGHLSESDRKAIFSYWYNLVCKTEYAALRMYLSHYDYEAISSAIDRLLGSERPRAYCVAFYGTLMDEHGKQEELGLKGKVRHLRSCTIAGEIRDLGEFPGLVAGDGTVKGELYELTDLAVFKILDAYEEFDPLHIDRSLFVRRAVRLKDPSVDCWVYFYNGDASQAPKVPDLQWPEYKRRREAGRQPV